MRSYVHAFSGILTVLIKQWCLEIYHLACPASPPHYQFNAVKTVKTSFMGTLNMLGLAKRTKARFLISSTSGKPSSSYGSYLDILRSVCRGVWRSRSTSSTRRLVEYLPFLCACWRAYDGIVGATSTQLAHVRVTTKANASPKLSHTAFIARMALMSV